jgi:hypothetical protein
VLGLAPCPILCLLLSPHHRNILPHRKTVTMTDYPLTELFVASAIAAFERVGYLRIRTTSAAAWRLGLAP